MKFDISQGISSREEWKMTHRVTHNFNREDLICVRLAVHFLKNMMQLQYILDILQLYKFYCMAKKSRRYLNIMYEPYYLLYEL